MYALFVGSIMYVSNLAAHLNHASISGRCVVRCGSKNGHEKAWCVKEIALHAATVIIV